MSDLPALTRIAWLLVAALASVVVALLAFMLKRGSGTGRSEAVFVAGTAFAGCMALCLGVLAAGFGT
ncbi:hypothetical protein [Streptomyces sp. NPDC008001]|uniref:hypothetical protein n=1 Tax=Streptomyces sp. NPDC008001 TaxID=3364804 RepID=UPI0036ED65D9